MEAFIGTWEYHHELADENEYKFLDEIKMDKKIVETLIASKPQVVIKKAGANLHCRMFSKDGKFDEEMTIKLDGTKSDIILPDSRKAKGTFVLKKGELACEDMELLDLPGVIVSEILSVKDDVMKDTLAVAAKNLKTVMTYKKI
ncbi:uncharacterized protein LOC141906129 [Tubulanus polymorphus]|uniref:uncharacterized protein LOC141906129 n=1 Tax=Tubulanus polymorphus TaxID=672921 RepID=UPI003DA5970B